MIYQVNRGERKLSPKALYRLEAAEIEVGIRKEFSGAFHCTPPLAPFARIFDNPVKQLEKLREAAKTAREFADKAEATAQQMEAWVRIAEKQHQRKQSTPSRPKKTGP